MSDSQQDEILDKILHKLTNIDNQISTLEVRQAQNSRLARNHALIKHMDKHAIVHIDKSSTFYTRVRCGKRVCNLIINVAVPKNFIAQYVVDKLNLLIELHPHPFKVIWKDDDDIFHMSNQINVWSPSNRNISRLYLV